MELLRSDHSELSIFALYPKTITWNFTLHMEPCLEVKIPSYHFLHSTENDNSEFFQAKVFNLENIVQAYLVSFQTHRVNKDFSNFVEDQTF